MCRMTFKTYNVSVVPNTLPKKDTGWPNLSTKSKCTHKCLTQVQSHISTQRQKNASISVSYLQPLGKPDVDSYKSLWLWNRETHTHTYTQVHTPYWKDHLYHTLRQMDSQILVIIYTRSNTHAQSNKQANIHIWKTGTATASLNQLPKVPTKCTGSPSYFKTLHNLDARQFYCFMEKGRWKKKKKQREGRSER